jgi:hypothetical protein
MSSRFSPLLRPVLGLLTVAAALSLGGPSRGQDDIPGNDEKTVEKGYQDRRTLIRQLLNGDKAFDPQNKEYADAIDAAAKYATYRFTWVTYEAEPGKIDQAFREFEDQLKLLKGNKKETQPEAAKAFSKAVGVRAAELLGSGKAIARVNAARVLAKTAELGQGDLADVLADVFEKEVARPRTGVPRGGERNDGVVYYALLGMRELLAVPNPAAPSPPVLTAERELRLTKLLSAFVTKPMKFVKETPKDEFEGYRTLRREAVRALAYCRAPSLKGTERPGMVLLRVAANDGVTPEARVDERLEAAIGVARMREASDGKEFQPEYAAFQLGQFLDYFASYYAENGLKKDDKELRPFRIYSTRLLEALDAMNTETKNAYVGTAVAQYRKLLTTMEKGDPIRTLDLTRWLDANPPKKDSLFQGVAESTVKPANRRGDGP